MSAHTLYTYTPLEGTPKKLPSYQRNAAAILMVCRRRRGDACNNTLMPQPWNLSLLFPALAHPYSVAFWRNTYNRLHASFCERNQCHNVSSATASLFERLQKDGLAWSAVGVDWSHLQQLRYPNAAQDFLKDPDIKEAVSVLDAARTQLDSQWSAVLFESDQPARRPKCALGGVEPLALKHFLRDGI